MFKFSLHITQPGWKEQKIAGSNPAGSTKLDFTWHTLT
jgi:hypothetical protein